jgi:hypothetical protein
VRHPQSTSARPRSPLGTCTPTEAMGHAGRPRERLAAAVAASRRTEAWSGRQWFVTAALVTIWSRFGHGTPAQAGTGRHLEIAKVQVSGALRLAGSLQHAQDPTGGQEVGSSNLPSPTTKEQVTGVRPWRSSRRCSRGAPPDTPGLSSSTYCSRGRTPPGAMGSAKGVMKLRGAALRARVGGGCYEAVATDVAALSTRRT